MKTYCRFLLIFALFSAMLGGCAKVPVKGEPPQYIGINQSQDQSQGSNSFIKVVIPSAGAKGENETANLKAPVIKSAYAIDRGIYGSVLKIYLEAEDPNGDMFKIATSVDQTGFGHYPTDFIILKPQYRKHFKGYIQWNTFSSKAPFLDEWTRIDMRVAVIDQKGITSNEFAFPFTFESGVTPAPNPPAPFYQGDLPKLGNVLIDLHNPRIMGGGNRD